MFHGTVLFEILLEVSSYFHGHSHGAKYDGEVIFGVIVDILTLDKGGLTTNLGTNVVMGETTGREEGDLLTTSDGVHQIDGRDTSLNHFLGVHSLVRVNRLALNIQELLSQHGGSLIDGHS
jgi:hypothetical protein